MSIEGQILVPIPDIVAKDPELLSRVKRHAEYLGTIGLREQMTFIHFLNVVGNAVERKRIEGQSILEGGEHYGEDF